MKEKKIRILIFVIAILVGINLYGLFKSDVLKSIGTQLIAAGFIAIILEIVLHEEFIDVIKKELKSPLKELGIGHDIAPVFINHFGMARKRVDIIAMSFTMGKAGYSKFLVEKICATDCEIRILILDPKSQFLEGVAQDEPDRRGERVKEKIEETITFFKEFRTEFVKTHGKDFQPKGSIRVKTHKSIPYFGYFRTEDVMIVTPYFSFGYGKDSPVFEVRKEKSRLFNHYEKHFDILWERHDSNSILDIGFFGIPEVKAGDNNVEKSNP